MTNAILRIQNGCIADTNNTLAPSIASPNKFYVPGLLEVVYDGTTAASSTNGVFFSNPSGVGYNTSVNLINIDTSIASGTTTTYVSGAELTTITSNVQDYTCTTPDSNGNPTLENICVNNNATKCSTSTNSLLMGGNSCDVLLSNGTSTSSIILYIESLGLDTDLSNIIVANSGVPYNGQALIAPDLKSHALGDDYLGITSYSVNTEGTDLDNMAPAHQSNFTGVCNLLGS